jgi:Protein of unknown function (DUF3047)
MFLMSCKKAVTWMAIVAVTACSHIPREDTTQADAAPAVKAHFSAEWQHWTLPGKKETEYSPQRTQGRDIIFAKAGSSASMLRRHLRIAAKDLSVVNFSWQVPELIKDADLAERDFDDSPVRIVLVFSGDKSKFSVKNAALSEMAEILSGESIPYATLMYVWCNKRAAGEVVINPRTDRIRSIVAESGVKNLHQWLNYSRDIRADFEKAFGEPAGDLLQVGIMTDSDNTRTQTTAAYGKVSFGDTTK